ncbi:MAG: hypothetical protein AAF585_21880 [Verrucomicrobiota bacterium]
MKTPQISTSALAIFSSALLSLCLPALAFNPASVPRHQKNAPEQLKIEVTQIKEEKVVRDGIESLCIHVEAKVARVTKSDTGLKGGEVIQIYYEIPQSDAAIGGGWPGKIQKGSYDAYLLFDKKDGKRYLPAAYTGTFVPAK